MGFSLKKVTKSISKAAKKVTSAAKNATSAVTDGIGKIADGKVAEGLGDIGQAGIKTGLDTATGGNAGMADAYSGGALSAAELAARGNSKDLMRVGVTGAAAFAGGPGAAMAVNSAYANGATTEQALLVAGSGGNMGFLSDVSGFLNQNPQLAQIANNAISGLTQKSAPKVKEIAPAVQQISVPGDSGMSTGMMVAIGAAVVGVALLALMILRKRK